MAAHDLSNDDLRPTTAEQRTWRWYHFSALWLGMIVAVPTYMLAGGLIESGLSALQAVMIILFGNLILLGPILLISHVGTRYGVPYAVAVRSSFGVRGAALPALARAAVACGWFGIQTFIGGKIMLAIAILVVGRPLDGPAVPLLGIHLGQLVCFVLFWTLQLAFINKGLGAIRRLETWTAPVKLLICAALVVWGLQHAHGLRGVLTSPSAFAPGGPKAGQFWATFWPALTAMVGCWATLALNIPDFSRFARSQKDQIIGQAIGLPGPMALLAVVSVITTTATLAVYGQAIWDPVALAQKFSGPVVVLGLAVILLDTVSCNMAANVVGPAYDFSSLWPSKISYRTGGYIAAGIGLAIMPWKLLESTHGYIFTWLTGYGALLGPICGIMIADYWLVRRALLVVDDLYAEQGLYSYRGGWNPAALIAFGLGVAPNAPGFLHTVAPSAFPGIGGPWTTIYAFAWMIGLAIALIVYTGLSRLKGVSVPHGEPVMDNAAI
jgi:NCS1 family nucleobase:cation symporter-1